MLAELQADLPPAHLLVHAGEPRRDAARPSLWHRLARRVLRAPRPSARAPVHLSIDDLAGRRLLELDQVAPLLDIPLPPGTYHVTACQGPAMRRYTMTLAGTAAHDLHLRLPGL
jgi:hypothetical protein